MARLKRTAKAPTSVSTLSAFVAHVENHCAGESVLFRGQCDDKPLLPKIARLNTAEGVLVAERRMFEDFKRQALPHLDHTPESDWDWLALAQHFGMATRLLDWSTNPLAALWFAVNRPARDGASAVVWYFEPAQNDFQDPKTHSDPFTLDRTRVFRPRHITQRIIAQAGYFTCHKYLEGVQRKYIPLDHNASFKRRLTKIVIPSDAFSDLRRDLDRFGVNAASLYGGLDGVCRHIEWLHSFLDDESADEHGKNPMPAMASASAA